MATSPVPTTPTGNKPNPAKRNYSDYMSADVLAAGGGLFQDVAANATARLTQSQIASGQIPDTSPKA